MIKLISGPWSFLKSLFGLVFPMFATGFPSLAGDSNRLGRWTARTFVLAVVLVILAMINQAPALGMINVIKGSNETVRNLWLPIFFLCLYAMIWLGWWLYCVIGRPIDPISSEFPDIDRAWSQALQKLKSEEIPPDEVPLFLVLGWPSSSEEAFFRSAGIRAQVKQHPNDPSDPLHVTANRHGIWITCPGASLLGQVNVSAQGSGGPADRTVATLMDETVDPSKTMGQAVGGEGTMRMEDILADYKKLQSQPRATAAARPRRGIDHELHEARLRHLCQLIARDRHGFCPVNGVLVLLPIGAADPASDQDEIARACKTDLTAAFDVFRMRCPVLAMICGLEMVPGFGDLVKQLPPEARKKRIGQRFPLVPELAPGEVPARVESSVEAIASALFPSMVQAEFQVEGPSGEDTELVLRLNSQLFRFLTGILDKRERLARLVKDCLPVLPGQPIMFGGCYFAATGGDAETQQAFASGVLTRMIKEDQNSVTWTEEAIADDALAWRRARFLRMFFLLVIVLLALAAVALIVRSVWIPPKNPGQTKNLDAVKKVSDDEP
jgi:IcmF-related N-terminal domain